MPKGSSNNIVSNMARLSDVYYTDKNLHGTPEPPGKAVPIDFYQGEDIVMEVFLNYNGDPVSVEEWEITGVVKKNKYADTQLWEAELDKGIYKTHTVGFYKVILDAEKSARFVPGTYWLTIFIKQKNSDNPRDLQFVVLNQAFSINDSAGSPYTRETLDVRNVERTFPPAFNSDKF